MSDKEQFNELKTDVHLLLECLKYQADNPHAVKQALLTLSSIFSNCDAEIKTYFQEIGGIEFLFNLVRSVTNSEVKEAALFSLGCCIEKNVYSQKMLSTKNTFMCLHELLSDKRAAARLKQTAAYFLLCLVSNNSQGQVLTKSSLCLSDLLELLRTSLPKNLTHEASNKESWFDDAGSTSIELWSSVASALCMCVNNPQNDQNQRVCGFALPQMFSVLEHYKQPIVIRPLMSLIGFVVACNNNNQDQVRRCGGLQVLVKCLKNVIDEKSTLSQFVTLAVQITSTIDSCIADNVENSEEIGREGAIKLMLSLLNSNMSLDDAAKLQLVVTLGHAVELSERNKKEICEADGLPRLIEHLTETEDEEFSKAVKYLLQICVRKKNSNNDIGQDENSPSQRNEVMHLQSGLVLLQKINEITNRLKTIEQESVENNRTFLQTSQSTAVSSHVTRYHQPTDSDDLCITPREKGLLYQLQKERKERQRLELINGQNFQGVTSGQFSDKNQSEYYNRNITRNNLCLLNENYKCVGLKPKSPNIVLDMNLDKQWRTGYIEVADSSGDHLFSQEKEFSHLENSKGIKELNTTKSQFEPHSPNNFYKNVESQLNKNSRTQSEQDMCLKNGHASECQRNQTSYTDSCHIFQNAHAVACQTSQKENFLELAIERDFQNERNRQTNQTPGTVKMLSSNHSKNLSTEGNKTQDQMQREPNTIIFERHSDNINGPHLNNTVNNIVVSSTSEETVGKQKYYSVGSQCEIPDCTVPVTEHIDRDTNILLQSKISDFNILQNENLDRNDKSSQCELSNNRVHQTENLDRNTHNCSQDKLSNHRVLQTENLDKHTYNCSKDRESNYNVSQTEKLEGNIDVGFQSKMPIYNSRVYQSDNTENNVNVENKKETVKQPNIDTDKATFVKPTGVPIRKAKSRWTNCTVRMAKPYGVDTAKTRNLSDMDQVSDTLSCSDVQSEFDCQLLRAATVDDKNNKNVTGELSVDKAFIMERFKSSSSSVSRTPKQCHIPVVKPLYSDCGPRRSMSKPLINPPNSVKPIKKPEWLSKGNMLPLTKHRYDSCQDDIVSNCTMSTMDSPGSTVGIKRLKENCPGCTASVLYGKSDGQRMNSRTYNLIIETSSSTCENHRLIREIERKYIQTIRKNTVSNAVKRLKKRKPLLDIYSKNVHELLSEESKPEKSVYDYPSSGDSDAQMGNVTPPHSRTSSVKTFLSRKSMSDMHQKRRPRIPYSDEEINNILTGVQRLGTRWNQILCTFVFHPSRTAVDISDKYKRLMNKKKRDENVSIISGHSKHEPFSMCEDRRLIRGIKMYGYSWKTILHSLHFSKSRTSGDLRNRWRSMHRKPGACKVLNC